jgi:hypothetical protein
MFLHEGRAAYTAGPPGSRSDAIECPGISDAVAHAKHVFDGLIEGVEAKMTNEPVLVELLNAPGL